MAHETKIVVTFSSDRPMSDDEVEYFRQSVNEALNSAALDGLLSPHDSDITLLAWDAAISKEEIAP